MDLFCLWNTLKILVPPVSGTVDFVVSGEQHSARWRLVRRRLRVAQKYGWGLLSVHQLLMHLCKGEVCEDGLVTVSGP